ncbi:choline ABC transporter permease subunit [Frigidibacter sp. ROC022]|uniref:choline ABC transporter permease subunit n=1 Tax=Frigidibacter sp. ROC022 TaxID=2971796 RepID=UPI00215A9BB7|nr:choline ABC transporter permease subunit [Frigidibacter sp. ROC022]MCR8725825.1 choline ABC transporter permease subunit [Frigidibacter sp. ROC022]
MLGLIPLLDIPKIPVGRTARIGFDWLKTHGEWVFDWLSNVLEGMIALILTVLQSPPDWYFPLRVRDALTDAPPIYPGYAPIYPEAVHPFLVILAFVALTWALQRSWKTCLLVGLGFLFIVNQDYWEETTESLTLVLSSCVVCMAVGVPIGIAAAHRPRLYDWMRPVLDLMQTLPTFVYLIPAIVFFGIGMVPGLIATVIFVLPAPIRLTHLGISTTPTPLLEAAEAFGATRRQTLWKVELPFALPQIMAGLNQTIMLSLSMVVIAALVGADGLGVPVVRALNSVNTALGFESGFVIVVLAIVLDRMLRVTRK